MNEPDHESDKKPDNAFILIIALSFGLFGLSFFLFTTVNNLTLPPGVILRDRGEREVWGDRGTSRGAEVQRCRGAKSPLLPCSSAPEPSESPVREYVEFATASALITEKNQATLNQLASKIAQSPPQSIGIQVIGYSSATGTNDVNKTLSRQRAFAVASYLRSRGLRHKIVTLWKGSQKPISLRDESNQRTEIRTVRLTDSEWATDQ